MSIRAKIITGIVTCGLIMNCSRPQEKPMNIKNDSASKIRSFTGQSLPEIAFPLGGIGTGCVSLGGRGDLRDWEIFNRPGKGVDLPLSFFAIWAQPEKGKAVAKILERKLLPPYPGGFGTPQSQMSGVARLDEATFQGEYPYAWIQFQDEQLPVQVTLQAWNPFIPLNDRDSSIPMAIFEWIIKNPSRKTVKLSLAACLFNPIGTDGEKFGATELGQNVSEYFEQENLKGLKYSTRRLPANDVQNGTMALTTTWNDLDVQTCWYRGGWWDNAHLFWDDFAGDGRVSVCKETSVSAEGRSDVGDLVLYATLEPGATITLPIYLTWHFPFRKNYWNSEAAVKDQVMQNYVAVQFKDAWDAAWYGVKNLERLSQQTQAWHTALFDSNLPDFVLDAVSSQASIIRTNTCLRLADSSFFAFEGQGDHGGCCWMNCTHVWNYEQTLAHLFPNLERSMRETDFLHNLRSDNSMAFRSLIPLNETRWDFKPAADGQMGCILKAYREWKISGDSDWLRKLWPAIKRALDYAWTQKSGWDPNKDGVMEGEQHNTYDIEFYGPNTMTGALYLGALKAANEMARALGDKNKAWEYHLLFESGKQKYDSLLWNGEYFIQKVEVLPGIKVPEHLQSPTSTACACKQSPGGKTAALESKSNEPKYQYGEGCLSDQLLGQWFAHVVDLGHLLNPEHVKTATQAIFKHNWRKPIGDFSNVQRVYALNDEAGLLLCSWPEGKRPALPFVYCDEVWTGIEYQVAAQLIYEGWVEEGLKVVQGVRDRYNGLQRNPWNEVECGHHYARALASWSVLLALSGCHYDGVKNWMKFAPVWKPEDFRSFWSSGSAWGRFQQKIDGNKTTVTLLIDYGLQTLNRLSIAGKAKIADVKFNNMLVGHKLVSGEQQCNLVFRSPLRLKAGDQLLVEFTK